MNVEGKDIGIRGSGCVAEVVYNCSVSDPLSREARSALMSRVRTRDTKPELILRRGLWAAGLRGWRCHRRDLPGRPDLAFGRHQIAIFVDGAFWHGHPEHYRGQSGPFWDKKIATNKARDRRVDKELGELEWTVLRFWDFEVDRGLERCVETIRSEIRSRN
jgi:DNA mismatch endonuclease (patch repair protein)